MRASWEGVGRFDKRRWAGIRIPSGRLKSCGGEEAAE